MELTEAEFVEAAGALEAAHPRWVWNDTAAWYPRLLAAGVRVERCVDLRLCHAILRASTLTAASELARAPRDSWATMPTAAGAPVHLPEPARSQGPTLFDHLDAPSEPRQTPRPLGAVAQIAPDAVVPPRAPESSPPVPDPRRSIEASAAALATRVDTALHEPKHPEPSELLEFRRQRRAAASATDPSRIALLLAAESAGSLAAVEMQHAGLPWSSARHNSLLENALGPRPTQPGTRPAKLEQLLVHIRDALGDSTANPDSPAELVKSLRRAGLEVSSTRQWELENIRHPAIPPLLEYKKLSRLLTANGWNWLDTWVVNDRFHPTYLPGGVVTGRWASEGGGALQLPKLVRSAVVADPGHVFVVADAAQLEPRILTALSGDRAMAAAGFGRDLYDGIVASGAVDTRAHAKLGMLGAMYGGTTGESGRLLPRLARAYPTAIAFVEDAARAGEAGNIVTTRLGRSSPRPDDTWQDLQDAAASDGATEATRARARSAARSWGRFTRNFVVQGTAAEWALCWISSLRRRLWTIEPDEPFPPGAPRASVFSTRPHLAFFLHDELLIHTPEQHAEAVSTHLREAAAEAGRLIFGGAPVQFPVTVAVVDSYDKAK
ncbi:bifunctional 3'-5' exonuclease/DNA polymerase [Herbiconiux sp. A18JL235]|uniref:DNA-directed DNA polymerase n=1 Tax=Herbiconiux sp. A18JL235 TaxID=3152363 RepID=A0AB39BMN3_9MICO